MKLMLWIVPKALTGISAFVWISLIYLVWGTFWIITNVPYNAWLSELINDCDERSSLIAVRMIFAVSGYIIGAELTPAIVEHFTNQRDGYRWMSILYGFFCSTALIICALVVNH